MKLSISNIAWSKEDDNEIYQFLVDKKYNAIEIAPTRIIPEEPYLHKEKAQAITKDIYERYGLKISSMQSIWYGRKEKLFENFEQQEQLINYTKEAIEFAEKIQCNNLVFGCPTNRSLKNKEDFENAIKILERIGDYAQKHNTVFSIEPNPTIYNTNFINTTKEAFEIAKRINNSAIRVNVDIGTMIINNEDLNVLDNNYEYINHIHISEPNLVPIKRRIAFHKELAKILKENNYQKYISIEMKQTDDIEEVKKAITYVKEVFQ